MSGNSNNEMINRRILEQLSFVCAHLSAHIPKIQSTRIRRQWKMNWLHFQSCSASAENAIQRVVRRFGKTKVAKENAFLIRISVLIR